MICAADALEILRAGNQRFADGSGGRSAPTSRLKRERFIDGQHPLAVIIGCSDSRVPVEMVFDQDLGDLFVIRVAGNVVAPSQIGSVEFAAEKFGTRLVVVLGHSHCGAVQATVEELQRPSNAQSPNLRAIVDRIRPAVEDLLASDSGGDSEALIEKAVRANVRHSAEALRRGSEFVKAMIRNDGLRIVGAEYILETGLVEFFDAG